MIVDKSILPPTSPITISIGDAEIPRMEDVNIFTEINDEPGGHPEQEPLQAGVVKPAVLP